MEKSLVSIILTVYEIKVEYLKECIDCLLNQTYQNFEIIIIDDCSPKTDYSFLTTLSPKIKYYRNEVNLKMNKSVTKAFGLAKGDYIVRLGSDDIFDKDLLKKEVEFLDNNPEYGAVCCDLLRFGLKKEHIVRPKKWVLEDIVQHRIFKGTGYAGGMMFRRELLETCTIDESLRMCEDFDFHLQMLQYTQIASINETLYYYRSHETNLCKSVPKTERWDILDKILGKYNSSTNHYKPVKSTFLKF